MNWWSGINQFSFASPWWLAGLLIVPAAIWLQFFSGRTKENSMRIPAITMFSVGYSWKEKAMKWWPGWKIGSLCFAFLALARPQLSLKEEKVMADGIDIMLAMDISSSMLSRDFDPDRLEVSKGVAREFVRKRRYDRIGLVVFSGEAFTQSPLTTDYAMLDDFLSGLEVGVLEDGTAIGMGLATAVNRMKNAKAKSKIIILLTDGVNNAGYVNPIPAAEMAATLGIRVYTIGVGRSGMAPSPVGRGMDGEYVFSMAPVEIDTKLLQEIAGMTKGKYYRAMDRESLESIYNEIDQLEKTEMEISVFKRYADLYPYFLWVSLAMLLIGWLGRSTVFRPLE
jgi:Ca-activated chloride channel family protein